jgi:hypothetical protein
LKVKIAKEEEIGMHSLVHNIFRGKKGMLELWDRD